MKYLADTPIGEKKTNEINSDVLDQNIIDTLNKHWAGCKVQYFEMLPGSVLKIVFGIGNYLEIVVKK